MKRIPPDMVPGTIHETNVSGQLVVEIYRSSTDVDVRFLSTGYSKNTSSKLIRSGQIKDKMRPSLFGIGFMGDGPHKTRKNGKFTKTYQAWNSMLERCYSEKLQSNFPTYKGCSVCEEWHNFQKFAEWFEDNLPKGLVRYSLDKDIKYEGNKVYSPDTCLIVTIEDNSSKSSSRNHSFISPSGEQVEIYNLKSFCKKMGLNRQCMHNVSSGLSKNHKGWTKK